MSVEAVLDTVNEMPGVAPVRVVRSTRASRAALAIGIALVAIAATLPWWGESSWMREFVEIACYFIFAMMWNLLAGYGGMVSIGQQAFFGFGGYVMLMLGNLLADLTLAWVDPRIRYD